MSFRGAVRLVLPPAVANRLRLASYRWSLRRFQSYQVRRSRSGHQFDLWISDPTARSWYDRESSEVPAEMAFLAQHRLRPGAVVFDCGAFQCLIAMLLAKFVGAEGKVVAVEASPHNFQAASRNCRLNGASNIELVNAAVSDTAEPLEFNCRPNGQVDDGSGAWGKISVPSVSVDELTRRFGPPDILFIDVEGFESRVMRGAATTLARHRPDCFLEMHVGCGLEKFGGSVKSITDTFEGLGYRLWMGSPERDTFVPFSAASAMVNARFFLIATAAPS
jgi:FkbM family methyltransferase